VDTDLFRPDPAARAEIRARHHLGTRPTIVCVSRLVARKGQDTLIRALPLIRDQVPGATLLLVGGGQYEPRLRTLAAACGVTDHVIFTGSVPWHELPAHYAAGDVFAMPCRTRGAGLDIEGLGIVYLEAAATGLPVITGDSGGAPETVLDGITGHTVNGRDIPRLAAHLTPLLADPTLAATMGKAAREWITDTYHWPTLTTRLTTLIEG
jgi:phosphatidylinositol alpha-1,6-mannosyltransferase